MFQHEEVPSVGASFTHLHQHTEFSMLDGAARVGDVVSRAAADGQPAVGITDHGNIYGAVLGGFLIGLIQSLAIQYFPGGNGIAWSDATVFAILVIILVFRPSGLLGQQIPDKV